MLNVMCYFFKDTVYKSGTGCYSGHSATDGNDFVDFNSKLTAENSSWVKQYATYHIKLNITIRALIKRQTIY